MPTTYTLITSTNLLSATADITFSSIPQTYDDLLFKVSARGTSSIPSRAMRIELNGNTTYSNYTSIMGGARDDNSIFADKWTSSTGLPFYVYGIPAATATSANSFSTQEVYIAKYSNGFNKKMIVVNGGAESKQVNFSGGTRYAGWLGGEFDSPSAITSVKFYPDSGNFATYTSISLYGIKNS